MSTAGPPSPPPAFGPPPSFGPPPPPFGGPPARGPRPATVTAAAGLMFLQAALSALGFVFALLTKDIAAEAARRVPNAADSPIKPEVAAGLGVVFNGVCGGLAVILFVVLGVLVLRGNNVARIVTWVVSGLFLLCVGIGGLFSAIGPGYGVPGWYRAIQGVTLVVELVIYAGVIVLLALPPSNEYFGRPPQGQPQY